ncbi:hypothetical protein BGX23_003840 [Mortierella sp. AD031]|nr:hypothetical protein BGX23_003840 [Mortierella sp. AD031]
MPPQLPSSTSWATGSSSPALKTVDNNGKDKEMDGTGSGQQQTAGDDDWEMPHLESISSTLTLPLYPHFANLVKRCPNLKMFSSTLDVHLDKTGLADSLRTYCASLETLVLSSSLPSDHATVSIRNCSMAGLRELEVHIHGDGDEDDLVSAILQYTETLEALRIYQSRGDCDIPPYLRLLVGCKSLEEFSLLMHAMKCSHDNLFEILKTQPWGSRKTLEQVEFGSEFCCGGAENPSDAAMMQELSSTTSVMGWYRAQQEKEQDAIVSNINKTKLCHAFEMTQGMECLETMTLDEVEFRR